MAQNSKLTTALWAVVLALGITQVLLFIRMQQLQVKLADRNDNQAGNEVRAKEDTDHTGGTLGYEDTGRDAAKGDTRKEAGPRMKFEPKSHAIDPNKKVTASDVEAIVQRMLKKRDAKTRSLR